MMAPIFEQNPLFPRQASTIAPSVDAVFMFILGVAAFFTILIATLIIVFAIRYRRRRNRQYGEQFPSPISLEITWTVIPFLITLVMFVWGASVYFAMSHAPDNAMDIYVVGRQWMWHIQHIGGQRENNELHVPVNRPIKLTLTSQDVIHNFSIPDFRVRQDVVPTKGRYSSLWFTATKPGKYRFFCAEYCGTDHSQMVGWVYVLEETEFQKWLNSARVDNSLATEGRKLFLKLQCITCHGRQPQGRAPLLENLYGHPVPLTGGTTVDASDDYIKESILHPDAKIVAGFRPIMPTYDGRISELQLLQLIAFIRSLREGDTPARVENTEPPVNAPNLIDETPRKK
jgi:cytochrome c oxidase subunit 2